MANENDLYYRSILSGAVPDVDLSKQDQILAAKKAKEDKLYDQKYKKLNNTRRITNYVDADTVDVQGVYDDEATRYRFAGGVDTAETDHGAAANAKQQARISNQKPRVAEALGIPVTQVTNQDVFDYGEKEKVRLMVESQTGKAFDDDFELYGKVDGKMGRNGPLVDVTETGEDIYGRKVASLQSGEDGLNLNQQALNRGALSNYAKQNDLVGEGLTGFNVDEAQQRAIQAGQMADQADAFNYEERYRDGIVAESLKSGATMFGGAITDMVDVVMDVGKKLATWDYSANSEIFEDGRKTLNELIGYDDRFVTRDRQEFADSIKGVYSNDQLSVAEKAVAMGRLVGTNLDLVPGLTAESLGFLASLGIGSGVKVATLAKGSKGSKILEAFGMTDELSKGGKIANIATKQGTKQGIKDGAQHIGNLLKTKSGKNLAAYQEKAYIEKAVNKIVKDKVAVTAAGIPASIAETNKNLQARVDETGEPNSLWDTAKVALVSTLQVKLDHLIDRGVMSSGKKMMKSIKEAVGGATETEARKLIGTFAKGLTGGTGKLAGGAATEAVTETLQEALTIYAERFGIDKFEKEDYLSMFDKETVNRLADSGILGAMGAVGLSGAGAVSSMAPTADMLKGGLMEKTSNIIANNNTKFKMNRAQNRVQNAQATASKAIVDNIASNDTTDPQVGIKAISEAIDAHDKEYGTKANTLVKNRLVENIISDVFVNAAGQEDSAIALNDAKEVVAQILQDDNIGEAFNTKNFAKKFISEQMDSIVTRGKSNKAVTEADMQKAFGYVESIVGSLPNMDDKTTEEVASYVTQAKTLMKKYLENPGNSKDINDVAAEFADVGFINVQSGETTRKPLWKHAEDIAIDLEKGDKPGLSVDLLDRFVGSRISKLFTKKYKDGMAHDDVFLGTLESENAKLSETLDNLSEAVEAMPEGDAKKEYQAKVSDMKEKLSVSNNYISQMKGGNLIVRSDKFINKKGKGYGGSQKRTESQGSSSNQSSEQTPPVVEESPVVEDTDSKQEQKPLTEQNEKDRRTIIESNDGTAKQLRVKNGTYLGNSYSFIFGVKDVKNSDGTTKMNGTKKVQVSRMLGYIKYNKDGTQTIVPLSFTVSNQYKNIPMEAYDTIANTIEDGRVAEDYQYEVTNEFNGKPVRVMVFDGIVYRQGTNKNTGKFEYMTTGITLDSIIAEKKKQEQKEDKTTYLMKNNYSASIINDPKALEFLDAKEDIPYGKKTVSIRVHDVYQRANNIDNTTITLDNHPQTNINIKEFKNKKGKKEKTPVIEETEESQQAKTMKKKFENVISEFAKDSKLAKFTVDQLNKTLDALKKYSKIIADKGIKLDDATKNIFSTAAKNLQEAIKSRTETPVASEFDEDVKVTAEDGQVYTVVIKGPKEYILFDGSDAEVKTYRTKTGAINGVKTHQKKLKTNKDKEPKVVEKTPPVVVSGPTPSAENTFTDGYVEDLVAGTDDIGSFRSEEHWNAVEKSVNLKTKIADISKSINKKWKDLSSTARKQYAKYYAGENYAKAYTQAIDIYNDLIGFYTKPDMDNKLRELGDTMTMLPRDDAAKLIKSYNGIMKLYNKDSGSKKFKDIDRITTIMNDVFIDELYNLSEKEMATDRDAESKSFEAYMEKVWNDKDAMFAEREQLNKELRDALVIEHNESIGGTLGNRIFGALDDEQQRVFKPKKIKKTERTIYDKFEEPLRTGVSLPLLFEVLPKAKQALFNQVDTLKRFVGSQKFIQGYMNGLNLPNIINNHQKLGYMKDGKLVASEGFLINQDGIIESADGKNGLFNALSFLGKPEQDEKSNNVYMVFDKSITDIIGFNILKLFSDAYETTMLVDEEKIRNMFGLDESNDALDVAYAKGILSSGRVPRKAMIRKIGSSIFDMLELQTSYEIDADAKEMIIAQLGILAIDSAADLGLFNGNSEQIQFKIGGTENTKMIDVLELNKFGAGLEANSEQLNIFNKEQQNQLKEAITDFSYLMPSVNESEIYPEAPTSVSETVRNSKSYQTTEEEKAKLKDAQSQKWFFNPIIDMLKNVSEEVKWKLAGWKDITKMHPQEVEAQISINRQIENDFAAMEQAHTDYGNDKGFHLKWDITKSGRYMIDAVINPQASKVFRFVMQTASNIVNGEQVGGMRSTIDLANKADLLLFKLSLAQAFDLDLDKKSDKTVLESLNDFIVFNDNDSNEIFSIKNEDLDVAVKYIKGDKNISKEVGEQALLNLANKGEKMHAVQAAYELAQITGLKFETSLMIEADAITSGMALTLLQIGSEIAMGLLAKAGIYTSKVKPVLQNLLLLDEKKAQEIMTAHMKKQIAAGSGNIDYDMLKEDIKNTKGVKYKAKPTNQITHGILNEKSWFNDFYTEVGVQVVDVSNDVAKEIEDNATEKKVSQKGKEYTRGLFGGEALGLMLHGLQGKKFIGKDGGLLTNQIRKIAKSPVMVYIYGSSIGSIKRALASLGTAGFPTIGGDLLKGMIKDKSYKNLDVSFVLAPLVSAYTYQADDGSMKLSLQKPNKERFTSRQEMLDDAFARIAHFYQKNNIPGLPTIEYVEFATTLFLATHQSEQNKITGEWGVTPRLPRYAKVIGGELRYESKKDNIEVTNTVGNMIITDDIISNLQNGTDEVYGKAFETVFERMFGEINAYRDVVKSIEFMTYNIYAYTLDKKLKEIANGRDNITQDEFRTVVAEVINSGMGHNMPNVAGGLQGLEAFENGESKRGIIGTRTNISKDDPQITQFMNTFFNEKGFARNSSGTTTSSIEEKITRDNIRAAATISIHQIDGASITDALLGMDMLNIYDATGMGVDTNNYESVMNGYHDGVNNNSHKHSVIGKNLEKLEKMLGMLSKKELKELLEYTDKTDLLASISNLNAKPIEIIQGEVVRNNYEEEFISTVSDISDGRKDNLSQNRSSNHIYAADIDLHESGKTAKKDIDAPRKVKSSSPVVKFLGVMIDLAEEEKNRQESSKAENIDSRNKVLEEVTKSQNAQTDTAEAATSDEQEVSSDTSAPVVDKYPKGRWFLENGKKVYVDEADAPIVEGSENIDADMQKGMEAGFESIIGLEQDITKLPAGNKGKLDKATRTKQINMIKNSIMQLTGLKGNQVNKLLEDYKARAQTTNDKKPTTIQDSFDIYKKLTGNENKTLTNAKKKAISELFKLYREYKDVLPQSVKDRFDMNKLFDASTAKLKNFRNMIDKAIGESKKKDNSVGSLENQDNTLDTVFDAYEIDLGTRLEDEMTEYLFNEGMMFENENNELQYTQKDEEYASHLKNIAGRLSGIIKDSGLSIGMTVNRFFTEERTRGSADLNTNTIEIRLNTQGDSIFNAAEIFMHETLHVMTNHAMELKPSLRKQVRTIQDQIKNKVDYTVFLNDKENPTTEDIKLAKDIYEYAILGDESEFLSYALANQQLYMAIKDMKVENTMFDKFTSTNSMVQILNKFIDIINKIYTVTFGARSNKAGQAINNLADDLATVQSNYLAKKMHDNSEPTGFFDALYQKVDVRVKSANSKIDSKIEDLIKNSSIGYKAKTLLDKITEIKGLQELKQTNFFQDIYHELVESTTDERVSGFYELFNSVKKIQEVDKEQLRTAIDDVLSEQLKGMSESHKKAAKRLLVDTDVVTLGKNGYTLEQVAEMLQDETKLQVAIDDVRKKMSTHTVDTATTGVSDTDDYINSVLEQAEGLGYYMVNGESPVHNQMKNANNIFRGLFNGKVSLRGNPDKKFIAYIDSLATLYALKYSGEENKVLAAEAIGSHKDGLSVTLNTFYEHMKEYNDVLFNSVGQYSDVDYQSKGYTYEQFDENKKISIVKEEDVKFYQYLKNESIGVMDQFLSDDISEVRHIMVGSNIDPTYHKGAMDIIGFTSKGMTLKEMAQQSGQSIEEVLETIENMKANSLGHRATGKELNIDSDKVQMKLMPKLDLGGNIIDYSTEMNHDDKVKHLTLNDDIIGTISNTITNTSAKHSAVASNAKTINYILDDASKNYASNPDDFIVIEPSRPKDGFISPTEKQWAIIPQYTKDFIYEQTNGKSLIVRKTLVNDMFGYRSPSIANIADMKKNHPRMYTAIRMIEKFWMSVIQKFKGIIVTLTSNVVIGNMVSNMFFALQHGVDPIQFAKSSIEAWKLLNQFSEDSRKLNQLKILRKGLPKGTNFESSDQEIRALVKKISSNKITRFVNRGMFSPIVEDINTSIMREKSDIDKFIDKISNKLPGAAKELLNQLYVNEETTLYKTMLKMIQYGDITARYAILQKMEKDKREANIVSRYTEEPTRRVILRATALGASPETTIAMMSGKDKKKAQAALDDYNNKNMSEDEMFDYLDQLLVNYGYNENRFLRYFNDIGFMMFTKYFLRTPKAIIKMMRKHPTASALFQSVQYGTGIDVIDPVDTFVNPIDAIINRIGNPIDMASEIVSPHITSVLGFDMSSVVHLT